MAMKRHFLFTCSLGAVTILSAALLSLATSAQSSQSGESSVTQTPLRSSASTESALDERQAQEWGLKAEEWTRYRQLMRGPLGIYSPNLDPLTALGIEARSVEERRHYAQLQVLAEGRRVEKTLAYQRAYDEAWKRLHPELPRVRALSEASPVKPAAPATASTGNHLAVFVKDDCIACEQRVKQLQSQGQAFDLYMVGSRQEDSRIRQWAARTGIDPAKVRAGSITLNHDAGRWLSIGDAGQLPAVLRQVNGQWQRQ